MKNRWMKLALVGIFIASGTAQAGAGVTDPGASCQASVSTSATYRFGQLCNSSTATLVVVCPIPRSDNSVGLSDAWVQVIDTSTSAPVSCTTYNRTISTSAMVKGVSRSTGVSNISTSPQRLSFGPVSGGGADYSYMECSLPPSSSNGVSCVTTYGATEDDSDSPQ